MGAANNFCSKKKLTNYLDRLSAALKDAQFRHNELSFQSDDHENGAKLGHDDHLLDIGHSVDADQIVASGRNSGRNSGRTADRTGEESFFRTDQQISVGDGDGTVDINVFAQLEKDIVFRLLTGQRGLASGCGLLGGYQLQSTDPRLFVGEIGRHDVKSASWPAGGSWNKFHHENVRKIALGRVEDIRMAYSAVNGHRSSIRLTQIQGVDGFHLFAHRFVIVHGQLVTVQLKTKSRARQSNEM